jgi:hypothetical protein
LSHKYPIVEEDSELLQNAQLKAVKLVKELSEKEDIDIADDLEKVMLGEFCINRKSIDVNSWNIDDIDVEHFSCNHRDIEM